ncbi:MAG: hypothetical protein Fur0022_21500 [Anaerolineales bacterium]
MQILETDYPLINQALTELDTLYRPTSQFSDDTIQKAKFICHEAVQRPEFWEGGFNMDAGLDAVMVFLREQYPWLTREAMYVVRHHCMMDMK